MHDHRGDHVDGLLADWARERPDLDPAPFAVVTRIRRAAALLEAAVDAALAPLGLTWGALDVLATLRRAGPPYRRSPTALYGAVLRSSGSMTNRIDRLERAGLVARTPDPDDRRGVQVGLTPAGLALIDRALAVHLATAERLLAALPAADRPALAALLRTLLLELETPPPPKARRPGGPADAPG
jgi:DNA-binding MarR family transcriptional regulator